MHPADKSKAYTGIGAGSSGVGSLVSILAFSMPYWVYYKEDLTLTDGSGSHQVQWTYYYGFWNYCNKVSSDVSNSDRCGSVESHSDAEQTTSVLLLLVILLFVSGVVNACLFLTIFRKEKICLYIAWVSVVVAGVLALTSIVVFAMADHSVTVTSNIKLNFSASKLYASFWLVVIGCVLVAIAIVFITLAIRDIRRTEDRSDDKKLMISYDSLKKTPRKLFEDDEDIQKEFQYEDPKVPKASSYTDSPYSTSSESLSDFDDSYDSDDSDIGPKFAKLKTKNTQSSVQKTASITTEERICKSSEQLTMVRFDGSSTPKFISSSLHRSRSASALTPVERADNISDAIYNNPLYQNTTQHMESGMAPVATNLFTDIRPPNENEYALVLRRAKTDMPLTQRMMNTIGVNRHKQNVHNNSVREPAEIDPDRSSPSLPLETKTFPKKPHRTKSKRKKPSEEELRRMKRMTDAYSSQHQIKTYFPGQLTNKPAPWSKAREKLGLRPKISKTLKWSLHARGVESIPKLPKDMTTKKKKMASTTKEHAGADQMDENSSIA